MGTGHPHSLVERLTLAESAIIVLDRRITEEQGASRYYLQQAELTRQRQSQEAEARLEKEIQRSEARAEQAALREDGRLEMLLKREDVRLDKQAKQMDTFARLATLVQDGADTKLTSGLHLVSVFARLMHIMNRLIEIPWLSFRGNRTGVNVLDIF